MSKSEEYEEIVKQREEIINKIRIFEESAVIKDYLELTEENKRLYEEQLNLYEDIKKDEYASCEHISVYSNINYDRYEGRTYKSCGCIKCGLDTSVLDCDSDILSFNKKIMYVFLKSQPMFDGRPKGINTEIACDLDLAQAIYSKIKEAHPNIDDKMATKYFEIELENIRNISESEREEMIRERRLPLNPNFNRWNASDVHHDY